MTKSHQFQCQNQKQRQCVLSCVDLFSQNGVGFLASDSDEHEQKRESETRLEHITFAHAQSHRVALLTMLSLSSECFSEYDAAAASVCLDAAAAEAEL